MRKFAWLICLGLWFSPLANAALRRMFRGDRCSAEMVSTLYREGQNRVFSSRAEFSNWLSSLSREFGLGTEVIQKNYARLNLTSIRNLMEGNRLSTNGESLHSFGGWGQDFLFYPNLSMWPAVQENFLPLAKRMGEKLRLDPLLSDRLCKEDFVSIGDSGWAIAESRRGEEVFWATVKITYFDPDATPDGLWPRYYTASGTEGEIFANYAPGGRSSLEHWGMLPLESHIDRLIPEHNPPNHPGLFSPRFY